MKKGLKLTNELTVTQVVRLLGVDKRSLQRRISEGKMGHNRSFKQTVRLLEVTSAILNGKLFSRISHKKKSDMAQTIVRLLNQLQTETDSTFLTAELVAVLQKLGVGYSHTYNAQGEVNGYQLARQDGIDIPTRRRKVQQKI